MKLKRYTIIKENKPYLHRWYVIPRNKILNIYFHHFVESDDDRALHDHPWWSLSIRISGIYDEATHSGVKRYDKWWQIFRLRSPTFAHKILLINNKPLKTIFITGPRTRVWGFWCGKKEDRFVPHYKFLDQKGC